MRTLLRRRAAWQLTVFTVAASFAWTPGSAAGATQAVLTVTGAPASAPNGSSFIVGTAGGSGTGTVTFSVSGGCSNSSGRFGGGFPQIAMTHSVVACVITATKGGDANYDPATSAPVSVVATEPVPVSLATLKAFTGPDGMNPAGPVVQAVDGWIYGLTVARSSGCATAFRFNPSDPAGTFATIWASGGQGGPGCYVEDGGLVGAGDGNFYFATSDGGSCNGGRIFRVSPLLGTVVALVDFFCDLRLANPAYGLTVGADGALYGVASSGGANTTGGIYRVGLDGALSRVASFPASFPAGNSGQRDALVAGSDGRLYGTVKNFYGSAGSFVYRVDPQSGSVETLYDFPTSGTNGSFPRGRLLEVPPRPGQGIAFAGVTQDGGTYGAGVVYRLDIVGSTRTFSKLHEFNVSSLTYLGETPAAGLTRAADGTLYGTTAGYAGFLGPTFVGPGTPDSGELGTLYRIGTDGVVSKLFGGPPLIQPFGPLLIGADGHLYGTSYVGDASGPRGSVVRVILPATLGLPTNLQATFIVGNTVTITWTLPTGGVTPTGYVLEGGVSPGEVLASIPTGSTATTYTFNAPTGSFYIRVHAVANGVRSAASNEIRIFVNVPAPPSAPANLLGMVNGSFLGLAWNNTAAGGAPTGLLIDVTSSPATSLSLPLTDSFALSGVPAGTHTLSLRATNSSGVSGSSNSLTLTFPGACSGAPATPTNFAVSKNGDLINASWGLPASGPAPTGHTLIVTGAFTGNFPMTARSITASAAPGSYTLSVVATNPCGSGPATASQTVVIP